MIIYDHLGRAIKSEHIQAVDELLKLKIKSGSDPWPVIEKCFKIWECGNPTRYNSYLIHVDDIKKTRKDPKYASTTDKVTGGILRYIIDIPEEVMKMIRCVYSPQELPMRGKQGKRFFQQFAKRFPKL